MPRRVTACWAAGFLLAGCSAGRLPTTDSSTSTVPSTVAASPQARTPTVSPPTGWVDQPVSFVADGLRIFATYRHPVSAKPGPAALLIAGSGVPDRNGDSPGAPENSLRLLARQLALDGVSSLRYDKLGSGETGLGEFADRLSSVRTSTYLGEAAVALRFLAAQGRTDAARLSVFGHSEGGLYALLLATGHAGSVPHIARLGLIEPLSRRFLDVADDQLENQIRQAVHDGQLASQPAAVDQEQVRAATAALRAGRAPGAVPDFAVPFFGPTNRGYTADVDRYDPARLATDVPEGTEVLLTCSPSDTQVPCSDVVHLDRGFAAARPAVDFVRIPDMDHALKTDTTPDGANDFRNLPMSAALAAAITRFDD